MKKYLLISERGTLYQTDYLKTEDFETDYIATVVNTYNGHAFYPSYGQKILTPDIWKEIEDFGD